MSGTQRLPGGVRRKASQRRSRPATPLQPLIGRLCILGTGCAGIGVFRRDVGDSEHAEIVIADRTYRVSTNILGRHPGTLPGPPRIGPMPHQRPGPARLAQAGFHSAPRDLISRCETYEGFCRYWAILAATRSRFAAEMGAWYRTDRRTRPTLRLNKGNR
jgi:hypothetical protein